MKRFATALVLLLLTLTLSIGAQLIFSKKTDELITGLEALLRAVDAGEGEERALENVEEAWRGSKKILHILLVHRSMDEIEININSLGEYLGAGDREALRQACTEALMQLENLRDAGRITIENILKIA
jgi:hypothetical protein